MTIGLSTGITVDAGTAGRLLLVLLMFAGLALHTRARHYELPEERVIVG